MQGMVHFPLKTASYDEILLESRVELSGCNGSGEGGLHWLCFPSQVLVKIV